MAIILNLNELMKEKGINVGELADKIGISPVNLSNIKNNKISAIRFSTLDAICRELDCQPGDMLEYQVNEKKRIIPRFLDYTGTTDLLLDGGAENVKKYFDSTIAIQHKTGCEIRDIMVTGSPLESAKSKLGRLSDLAENYGLPNLYDCAIAEYCGFAIRKDKSESLLPIDPRIVENRSEIENIIKKYSNNGEINPSNTSYYNVVFEDISQTDLARVAEEIEKLMEERTGDKSIETLTCYDYAGKECDIKPKIHTKPRGVLMVIEQLRNKYNIPLVIIGGDSQQEDLKMYTETKQTLSNYGIPSVFIAPSNIGEFAKFDENIITGDWENFDGIAHCMEQLTSRIKVKEDGGLEI